MKIEVREPYAGQFFVLSEDCALDEPWVFECEHELSIHTDSFSHDAWPNGSTEMTWVECDYGCDVPEHIQQAYIDNYYDGMGEY